MPPETAPPTEPDPVTVTAACVCDIASLSRVVDHLRRQRLHDAGLIDVTQPFGTVLPHNCAQRNEVRRGR